MNSLRPPVAQRSGYRVARRIGEVARARARQRAVHRIGLWLPATPIFVLLAPFPILAIPLLYLAPRRVLPDPFGLVFGVGRLLLSLGGTLIEVDTAEANVRIRLF